MNSDWGGHWRSPMYAMTFSGYDESEGRKDGGDEKAGERESSGAGSGEGNKPIMPNRFSLLRGEDSVRL